MIPEAGNRADFKQSVLDYCTRAPLPGEQYEVDDGAKIFNSMGAMGRKVLTVTYISGSVHFEADFGEAKPRQCVFFGYKWQALRAAGTLKFIGYAQ
jgi:hypothetical protein